MSIPAGTYKGRGVVGSEQFGVTKNGNEQIVVDLDVALADGEVRRLSTFLYFSDAAAQYALDRLRALGWTGDDVTNLAGIDANEVDVDVKYEMYDGEPKMRVEINTGGGRVKLTDQMNDKQKAGFAARMKAFAKGAPMPKATGANGSRRAPAGPERPFPDGGAGQGSDDFVF